MIFYTILLSLTTSAYEVHANRVEEIFVEGVFLKRTKLAIECQPKYVNSEILALERARGAIEIKRAYLQRI